jgi:hypothetical protein
MGREKVLFAWVTNLRTYRQLGKSESREAVHKLEQVSAAKQKKTSGGLTAEGWKSLAKKKGDKFIVALKKNRIHPKTSRRF